MEGGGRDQRLRIQGFKWSSRVKLGSFTDSRGIPERSIIHREMEIFKTNDATSS